jgi:hypothetical protein
MEDFTDWNLAGNRFTEFGLVGIAGPCRMGLHPAKVIWPLEAPQPLEDTPERLENAFMG